MKVKANLFKNTKTNTYYIILNYQNKYNERKQKWIPTKISIKGNNKRLANEKLEEIKSHYEDYIPNDELLSQNAEENKLFSIYIKDWLKNYKNQLEENTFYSYSIIVNRTSKYFEDKKITLKNLKPSDIQTYYNYLFSLGLGTNSVLHHHAIIRRCLNIAFNLEIISSNPADKLQRPKKSQFIGDYYSIEELEKLFKVAKDDPLEIVILLASFYGLRRSEILGLTYSACNFTNNTLTIKRKVIETIVDEERTIILKDKTKNSSSYRSLPLIPQIKDALLKHKSKIEHNMKLLGNGYNKQYKDYICVDSTGKIFRPEYITDHFSLLLKRNGLRHIRFHDLRHSAASNLLNNGVSMKAIQEYLGHSTFSTTANTYSHLESNAKLIAANTLANIIKF